MQKRSDGFTLVELLIVIVVIGILAAISIVTYNGIQDRANDTAVKAAAVKTEEAILLWANKNGQTIPGGSGSSPANPAGSPCTTGQDGFIATGVYACSIEDTLVASSYLPSGFTAKLPGNKYYGNNSASSIMLYKCGAQIGQYALFWTLRSPTTKDTDQMNSIFTVCNTTQVARDQYGMRGGKIIQL